MSDIESQPNKILHFYQEVWRTPEALMPGAAFVEHCSETAQKIVAAQVAYAQAAMSMNAKLFSFWLDHTEDSSPVHVAEDELARAREIA